MTDIDNKIDEYKEAGLFHRLFITLMFGQIAVYLVASGVVLKTLISDQSPDPTETLVLALIGIVLSLVFFVISQRAGTFSHSARERAKEIEKDLGFNLHSRGCGPKVPFMTAINATRLLYSCGIVGWVMYLSILLLR